ncbi:unnamed protein product [Paramecium octaurelia]|uniref:Ion transport domain-containing protein n=1 Tax=Paramecium octaurelia TaxID=43137 RepID=A0A8S1WGH9_PAROT|nr:unnamed protein product [Paramecium octaurelia]
MQQVNAVKQQKQVSVFQQPQKGKQTQKKIKWDAQSDPKQEQSDQNKSKQQTASVVLDKNKLESQLSKGTQIMKESLKSSQKSQTLRSDKKRFTQNRTSQNQTLILLQENQIYEKPARDEESASEQYNTYNVEQEHSMIVLNEALTRQASKKAFEQLLKENESYRLDASNFGDCVDESQTNKQQQIIQREEQDNQDDLKNQFQTNNAEEKPEEQEEKENQILQMLHENLYNEESQNYNIELKVNHNFKWLLMEIKHYQDNNKLLYFRKILFFIIVGFEICCYRLLQWTAFDLYEMFLTLTNIILFLNRSSTQQNEIQSYQYVLCALYFADSLIHLAGQGFKKYISSFWNIYDLIILILYFLFLIENDYIPFDVSTFRLIRIPFYVGKISSTLNIMLMSIQEAVKQIVENILILILFTILIALIMLYAFNGVIRYRCMNEELGIFSLEKFEEDVCGYVECEHGYVCARQLSNLDTPTHFDDIIFSYFQTIRTSVVNDWTISMYVLMKQFNPLVCILYIFIIFAINKFYFQLLIAVLKVSYHKTQEYYVKNPIKPESYEDQISVNLQKLKAIGMWQFYQISYKNYLKGKSGRLNSKSFSNNSQDEPHIKGQKHIFPEIANQEKTKLLSARQKNEMINERHLIQQQYTFGSWIIYILFPNHKLQNQMKSIIQANENHFNELQLYYTFLSIDYLSLNKQVVKGTPNEFNSIQDLEIQPKAPIPTQTKTKTKKIPKIFAIQTYVVNTQNDSVKENQKKVEDLFPIRKSNFAMHYNQIQQANEENNISVREFSEDEINSNLDQSRLEKYPQEVIQIKKGKSLKHMYSQKFQQSTQISKTLPQLSRFILLDGIQLPYQQIEKIINAELKIETQEIKDYEQKYYDKESQISEGVIEKKWSGNDLMKNYKANSLIQELNRGWNYYFAKGFMFYLEYIKFYLGIFITQQFVMVIIDSFVCIDTLLIAFSDYYDSAISDFFDLSVNILLVLEILIKSICIKGYLYKVSNILGCLVITISAIERILTLTIYQNEEVLIESFTYIRILKSLFFFRVIKYNTFAQNMMVISYQTFPNYAMMTLLLFFLILNYAVFSLQIFNFPDSGELALFHYFGNIYQSWIAVYDISTSDDWYGVVILSTTYSASYIAFLFCISLVFIVNYFGFGLAFVIILDGFASYLENVEEIEEEKADEQDNQTHASAKIKKNFTLNNILSSLIQPEENEKFKNIKNQYSLFLISKKNKFRKLCFSITENKIFKSLMILILWGSLINLIVITYTDQYRHEEWGICEIIKLICNLIILIDGILQIITYGLLSEDGYFNSIWVFIDFFYIICYFLHIATQHEALEWMLFLGYLRPLKVTSTYGFFINERGAIMKSLGDIISIFYVVLLFWFIFAIFGMTIYRGKMGYCGEATNYGVSKEECEEEKEEWIVYQYNFDNILEAMQSLYVLSTFDLWAQTLFICINSAPETTGPIRFNNEWISYLFFFSFTFVGALFFLQFFAGVIFVNFQQNKSQLLNPDLTLDQELFLKLSDIIMQDTPNYSKPPKKGIRLGAKKLLSNSYYIFVTKYSLLINLFILMLLYESASNHYLNILNGFQHFFSLILTIDCVVKLFSLNIKRYFDDVWRQMQLIFVICAIIDFFLDIQHSIFIRYVRASRDDPYFVWLRLFILHRCLRMALIIQQFTRIRKLLNVIYFNKMALLRILGLFVTVLSCYSYIGCELFSDIETGFMMNDQQNFTNFFYGLIVTFKCTIENGWRFIYQDSQEYMKEHHQPWVLAQIFYYSLIFVGARVLLNLIVCELVQEFEKFYDTSSSCVETYVETIDTFRNLWCKYSEEFYGTKIQTKYLAHFLLELGEPLGARRGDNIWDAAKHASEFELKKDFDGCLTFRNLLYEVFKAAFKESIFKISTKAGKKIMKDNDKKVKYRLYNQRNPHYRREVVSQIVDLQSNFNILQEYLYLYMTIKAWKAFSGHFLKAAEAIKNTIDCTESDVDVEIAKSNKHYNTFDKGLIYNQDAAEADSEEEEEAMQFNLVRRQKKRRPTAEHLRRPTDVYILPYYDELRGIDKRAFDGNDNNDNSKYILKPTDQKQQNKLKSISVIKKKEQLIKYNDYSKRRDAIDKQIQSRNKYLYGYHDKMVLRQIVDDKQVMSRLDPMKVPSNYNIMKIGSRLK